MWCVWCVTFKFSIVRRKTSERKREKERNDSLGVGCNAFLDASITASSIEPHPAILPSSGDFNFDFNQASVCACLWLSGKGKGSFCFPSLSLARSSAFAAAVHLPAAFLWLHKKALFALFELLLLYGSMKRLPKRRALSSRA